MTKNKEREREERDVTMVGLSECIKGKLVVGFV